MIALSVVSFVSDNSYKIERTYNSLREQKLDSFEWIIIDNTTTKKVDYCEDWCKCYNLSSSCSIPEIFNHVYHVAQGKYLLFWNSGSVVQGGFGLIIDLLQRYNKDIIWGNIISTDGDYEYNYPQREDFSMFYLIEHQIPLQSALIRRELFEKIGWFECGNIAFDFAFFFKTIVANQCTIQFLADFSVMANPFGFIEKHTDRSKAILESVVRQFPRIIGEDNVQLRLPSEVDAAMSFFRFMQNNRFIRLLYSIIVKPFNYKR